MQPDNRPHTPINRQVGPGRPISVPHQNQIYVDQIRRLQAIASGKLVGPTVPMTPQQAQDRLKQIYSSPQYQPILQMMQQTPVARQPITVTPRPAVPVRPPQTVKLSVPSTNLLPPVNQYAHRIRRGETGLLQKIVTHEPVLRKRGRFVEEDSDEFEDSDSDENMRSRRQSATPVSQSKTEKAYPPILPKRVRVLPTTKHEYEKLTASESVAAAKEMLVPIRLELDLEGVKIRDQFTWNMNETTITPEKFAEYLCVDLGININQHGHSIATNINNQINDWRRFYQREDFPVQEDSRVPIKLDVYCGSVHLQDRFEWDLSANNSPEDFARSLVRDLGLGGEFVALVAHSIREQILRIRREGEQEATFAIEKPLRAEEEAKSWSPFINLGQNLNGDYDGDLDRQTRALRREQRLTQNRRRGTFEIRPYLDHHQPFTVANTQGMPQDWQCHHCKCPLLKTDKVKDGPAGENTLCHVCGIFFDDRCLL
ncbi:hypothetical protein EDD86DRAFT_203960 [Gorgonomyces haynaldii]|nr:hypothetical protein EDD86DRAFT_203960 [Gorgonomyces haynaldii]